MTFQLFGDKNVKEKKKKEVREPAPKPSEEKIKVKPAEGWEGKNAGTIVRQAVIVDEDYLRFIRGKACLIQTGCVGPVDPDHLTARGTGEHKRNDYTAIPLCRMHHGERGNLGNDNLETKNVINF